MSAPCGLQVTEARTVVALQPDMAEPAALAVDPTRDDLRFLLRDLVSLQHDDAESAGHPCMLLGGGLAMNADR
jgi:hypothetical protein